MHANSFGACKVSVGPAAFLAPKKRKKEALSPATPKSKRS